MSSLPAMWMNLWEFVPEISSIMCKDDRHSDMGTGINWRLALFTEVSTCSIDSLFTTCPHTTISTLLLLFHWLLLRIVVDELTRTMPKLIDVLKDRYECPYFRILIVGRANAGKTTIIEKMCNVKHGTIPIVYDRRGIEVSSAPEKQPTSSWRRVFGHSSDSRKGSTLMPSIYVSYLEYYSSEMNADCF
jgi:hypothetical protein